MMKDRSDLTISRLGVTGIGGGSTNQEVFKVIKGSFVLTDQIDEISEDILVIDRFPIDDYGKGNWIRISQWRIFGYKLITLQPITIVFQKMKSLVKQGIWYDFLSLLVSFGVNPLWFSPDSGDMSDFLRIGILNMGFCDGIMDGKWKLQTNSKIFSTIFVDLFLASIWFIDICQDLLIGEFMVIRYFWIFLVVKAWRHGCLVFIGTLRASLPTSIHRSLLSSSGYLIYGIDFCFSFLCFTMTQGQWIAKSGGKKEVAKAVLKITVPRFDNSELIASYEKTLIGRCMNPPKQDMKILLFMLPKIWQVEGRVVGLDLGLGRFQFDFELEEDIVEVLKMEPFHFDYWMVSLVRWKPVLEVNYPSKITFWVRVLNIPLQFRVSELFRSVGEAIGQVHGEVDLVGGRVRVELDGFKPLVFSMAVEIEEGVEIMVSLRYEKLFGFCRECSSLTHDKTRCPSLQKDLETDIEVKGDTGDQGASVTSYKAAVSNGKVVNGDRREGYQNHSRYAGDRNKGKGIVRDKAGPYRQDGSYHAYKERRPRGNGDVSSFQGRRSGYLEHRNGLPRNEDQSFRSGVGGQHVNNPEKLMLDAFKGLNHSSQSGDQYPVTAGESGVSKTRKALLFDEGTSAEFDAVPTAEVLEESREKERDLEVVQVQRVPEGVLATKDTMLEDSLSSQALDDANLMVEGELLSDSELMVDEDIDEVQEWEQGEITDLMEEEVMGVEEEGGEEQVDANDIPQEGASDKAGKKKSTKVATSGVGGAAKKRFAHGFVSPRKKLMAKALSKMGDKGVAPTKKASAKPKNISE